MSSARLRILPALAGIILLSIPLPAAAAGPTLKLLVDATQAPLKIIHTQMSLPVQAGPLTLYYPKWIPGEHAASGPVVNMVGLVISGAGKLIPWRRDLVDMFAFHLDVPAGVTSLDIKFDYIEPNVTSGFSAGSSATAKMMVVSWNQNVLYPAGARAQEITYEPTLRLPQGWKFGTALPVEKQDGEEIQFKPVSLNRLVDSPVIAGEYLRVVDVTPPGEPIHHEMDIAADSEAALDISPELRQDYVNLVAETGKLFGARHYRDYHFLLSLSDHVAHFGLEHHESDDSRVSERSLIDKERREAMASLLPHEFVHSWNGKFRRPADLSTPYYDPPEKTDLLWVYEGLTNFLGDLLAERSGLWTPEQYREYLAMVAAELGPGRPGRTWRPLQDTADAAQILYYAPRTWVNWRRSTDYYPEGDLIWLEVDTIIRQESHGTKTLTDFLHEFYGGPNNGPELKTYTFDDIVEALNKVQPYDWAAYFHKRLDSTSREAPLGGIENGGWKVVYTGVEPELLKARAKEYKFIDALYSIGLELNGKGVVRDSVVGMPAYKAGITPDMKVVAINGRAFTKEVFHDALKATAKSSGPLELLVLNDDYYKTVSLDYHGGERYPHLVREEGKPDLLGEIEKPLAQP
jgi:predicted metalloprotease with PDZ domain